MVQTMSLLCAAEQSGCSTSSQAGAEGAADAARARRGGDRNPAGTGSAQGRPATPRQCVSCRLLMLHLGTCCDAALPCEHTLYMRERLLHYTG